MWVCYCGDSAVGRGERKVTYVLGVMGRDADHLVERHLSMWLLFYFILFFVSRRACGKGPKHCRRCTVLDRRGG